MTNKSILQWVTYRRRRYWMIEQMHVSLRIHCCSHRSHQILHGHDVHDVHDDRRDDRDGRNVLHDGRDGPHANKDHGRGLHARQIH